MSAPPEVEELVERLRRNLDVYKRDDYKETRVRVEFVGSYGCPDRCPGVRAVRLDRRGDPDRGGKSLRNGRPAHRGMQHLGHRASVVYSSSTALAVIKPLTGESDHARQAN